ALRWLGRPRAGVDLDPADMRVPPPGKGIRAHSGVKRRGTERQPRPVVPSRDPATWYKVPTVVPDIPVIHRVVTENFASATRGRGAWCSCDRDGGPGLPKSRQRQAGAAGDQRSDLRRQAMEGAFGF